MNLLAAKIGTLQAKLVSIDGLGQRVARWRAWPIPIPSWQQLASAQPSVSTQPEASGVGRAVHRPDAAHGRLGRGTGPAAGRHPGQAGAAVRQSEAAGRRVDAAFGGPGAHADRHAHHRLSLFEFVLRLAPQPGTGRSALGLLRAPARPFKFHPGYGQHGRDRPWRRPDHPTRTPRRCWSAGSWSIAASRSLASAAPAVPPVRTCTSRLAGQPLDPRLFLGPRRSAFHRSPCTSRCGWPASRWIRACSWGRSRTLRRPCPPAPARTAPRADPAAGCKRDGLIMFQAITPQVR